MKDQFIPYELAFIAKEKGFNQPCIVYYGDIEDNGIFTLITLVNSTGAVTGILPSQVNFNVCAPLYQQIVDWLFTEHNLWIEVTLWDHGINCMIKKFDNIDVWKVWNGDVIFKSRKEAMGVAIKEAFKLIDK